MRNTPLLIERPNGTFWRFPDGMEVPVLAGGDTIDRTGADALIPEEVSREIIKVAPEQSGVLRLARRLPNMTRKQQRMPVLAGLVVAGFVTGEVTQADATGGRKPTGRALWENKYIDAEEVAVIVPIAEAVLDDADYDIWAEVRPQIEESIGNVVDKAILYGTNAPTSWPDDILTGATNAGHIVVEGTGADLYDDIFAVDGVYSLVEEDGYDVTGNLAALRLKARLRALRDSNLQPLFSQSMQERNRYALDGVDCEFPKNGGIDPAESLLISGDWSKLVYAIRQDITYKILDQAVIQDPSTSEILYNLATQDMVALRCVFRLGWQLPNPINRVNETEATRFPFAVLTPAGT